VSSVRPMCVRRSATQSWIPLLCLTDSKHIPWQDRFTRWSLRVRVRPACRCFYPYPRYATTILNARIRSNPPARKTKVAHIEQSGGTAVSGSSHANRCSSHPSRLPASLAERRSGSRIRAPRVTTFDKRESGLRNQPSYRTRSATESALLAVELEGERAPSVTNLSLSATTIENTFQLTPGRVLGRCRVFRRRVFAFPRAGLRRTPRIRPDRA